MEIKTGLYRHFKGGLYRVIGTGLHSETQEQLVVYKSTLDGWIWLRPVSMWSDIVEYEGASVQRFTFMAP